MAGASPGYSVPHLEPDSENEDEISCELKVFGEDDSVHKGAVEHGADGNTFLDWSLSCISAASGMDPDRFRTNCDSTSSSALTTPEKVSAASGSSQRLSRASDQPVQANGDRGDPGSDINKIFGSIRDLQANLMSISQKTETPINSPRKPDSSDSNLNNTTVRRADSLTSRQSPLSLTPPVKDSGPGTLSRAVRALEFGDVASQSRDIVSGRLDQMRSVLKELETARKKYSTSKIPRRSADSNTFYSSVKNFGEDRDQVGSAATAKLSVQQTLTAGLLQTIVSDSPADSFFSAPTSACQDQEEQLRQSTPPFEKGLAEMNTFLERVEDASSPTCTAVLGDANHQLDKTTTLQAESQQVPVSLSHPSLPSQEDGTSNNQTLDTQKLEDLVKALSAKVTSQSEVIKWLESSNSQKVEMLTEFKSRWNSVVQQWSKDQNELVHTLRTANEEARVLRAENKAAKEQFEICQEELSKALHIASDFEAKLDGEEKIKQDMLDELLSERTSKVKQLQQVEMKNSQMVEVLERYKVEIRRLQDDKAVPLMNQGSNNDDNDNLSREQPLSDCLSAVETFNLFQHKKLQQENEELQSRIRELEDEVDMIESSLHAFYANQIESILTEKICGLQTSVKVWEGNMIREKQEALELLKAQHKLESDNLSSKLKEEVQTLKGTIEVLETTLAASKMECQSLKGQLSAFKHISHGSATVFNGDVIEAEQPPGNQGDIGTVFMTNGPPKENHPQQAELPAIERQKKLWSDLLKGSVHSESLSLVQNNLFGPSPREGFTEPIGSLNSVNGVEDVGVPQSSIGRKEDIITADNHRSYSLPNTLGYQRTQRPHRHKSRPKSGESSSKPSTEADGVESPHLNIVGELNNSGVKASEDLSAMVSSDEYSASSAMTTEEKKDVVKKFVMQFFKEHPEAVLDPQLMFSLNKIAVKLVDQSINIAERSSDYSELLKSYRLHDSEEDSIEGACARLQTQKTSIVPMPSTSLMQQAGSTPNEIRNVGTAAASTKTRFDWSLLKDPS